MRFLFRVVAFPLTLILLNLAAAGCTNSVSATSAAPADAEARSTPQPHDAAKSTEAPAHAGAKKEQASETEKTAPAAPNQIVIDNFTYSPASLTVPSGTRVTWVNHDDVPHTVTSPKTPRILDSPTLDTDDTYTFEFKEPGTYEYFCAVHPKMTAKIIVK
jgi:plastocyanin